MSKFRRWIEADELMKRWELGPLDLTDYVLESKLTAYTKDKKPHSTYYDLLDDEQLSFEWIEIDGKMEKVLGTYVFFGDRINEFIFKLIDIIRFEKEFIDNYPSPAEINEKSLRPNQRHIERCRAIAALLWEKNPKMTIADMIITDEITKYGCENKIYNEKTLRKWINDLCPDRSHGRRPNSK